VNDVDGEEQAHRPSGDLGVLAPAPTPPLRLIFRMARSASRVYRCRSCQMTRRR
jgi:hypothetical protein